MSWSDASPPTCDPREDGGSCLAHVLTGTEKDLGGLWVRRVLPDRRVRRVGPFLFLDHFGPAQVPAGGGMNVRPHPHIHLATLTYLFEGAVMHHDSLGSVQRIAPGAINLMVAGRGIVHSERTPPDLRDRSFGLHGLQIWIALPRTHEDMAPSFSHHPAESLPVQVRGGVTLHQLVGEAFGLVSPVPTVSPMFYTSALLEAGAQLALPEAYAERAAYVVSGEVSCEGQAFGVGQMLVFRAGGAPGVVATAAGTRLALLGGAPLDGDRHMWWNFVSSDPRALEAAKRDWKSGRFPPVPSDPGERIPLPEEAPHLVVLDTDDGGELVISQQGEPLGELAWRHAEVAGAPVMDILHTRVDDRLQGQGWARRLVRKAVELARQKGVTILPRCPYAREVLRKDETLQDILAPGWQQALS